MTFAIYESIKMNTTSVQLQSPDYHVIQVIPEAPDGTTREGAIHHLAAAGYYLQYGQEIRDEPEWPEEVRIQVNSPDLDPKSRRSWADFKPKTH